MTSSNLTTTNHKTATVQNGDTLLHVQVFAPEFSETVLLLHGGPGVPYPMLEVVDILKEKYRVITFDQRGTGAQSVLPVIFQ